MSGLKNFIRSLVPTNILNAYRDLKKEQQRKLIREVILTFAKVHQGGAAPHDASAGPVHPE